VGAVLVLRLARLPPQAHAQGRAVLLMHLARRPLAQPEGARGAVLLMHLARRPLAQGGAVPVLLMRLARQRLAQGGGRRGRCT
jgi:hypothetical protein